MHSFDIPLFLCSLQTAQYAVNITVHREDRFLNVAQKPHRHFFSEHD